MFTDEELRTAENDIDLSDSAEWSCDVVTSGKHYLGDGVNDHWMSCYRYNGQHV
jgi:hypothetical protein